MECANLKTNTSKIQRIHFSYNRRLEHDDNYRRYLIKAEKLLKLLKLKQLTIEDKSLNFKILSISKVVHLALVKDVPSSTIAQLEKNTKSICLEKRKP